MADDPLADMQNLIGYQGLVGPNPYLQYQGKIPIAGYYTGDAGNLPPTDASGNPIQSFVDYNNNAQAQYQKALAAYNAQPGTTPGTTLNSTPASAGAPGAPMSPQMAMSFGAPGLALAGAGGPPGVTPQTPYGLPGTNPAATWQGAGATPQQMAGLFSQMSPTIPGTGGTDRYGNYIPPQTNPQYASRIGAMMAGAFPYGQQGAAASSKGPPPTPPDLRQAYLNALANPGPVPRYGAQPPQPGQTPTGTPSPSVLGSFLAANKGNNSGFLNTLRGLTGAGP